MERNSVISVDFIRFHNEEVYQCMDSVRRVVTDGPDMSAVQADLERFTDSFTRYDVVLEPIRQTQYTPEIERLDKSRDASYTGMHTVVLGYKDSPNTDEKWAATMLNTVFTKYKGIQQFNYQKEIGSLKNFCQELDGPYQSYVETLHLTEWFEALKQMNADFEDLYDRRRIENDAQATSEEVKAAREALVAAFRNLTADFEAMVRLSDSPEGFQEVIAAINSILQNWKLIIDRRKNNQNEDEEDDNENEGDENDGEENGGEGSEDDNTDPNQGEDNTPSANA